MGTPNLPIKIPSTECILFNKLYHMDGNINADWTLLTRSASLWDIEVIRGVGIITLCFFEQISNYSRTQLDRERRKGVAFFR